MADTEAGERSEEPTQQRREDFRKRGQVAQTRELGAVLSLGSTFLILWLGGTYFLGLGAKMFTHVLSEKIADTARNGDWLAVAKQVSYAGLIGLAPVLVLFWFVGLFSTVAQVGFVYNEEALDFKFERLNPVEGFMRLLSWRSVVEGVKALIKVTVIALLVYWVLRSEINRLPTVAEFNVQQLFVYMGIIVSKIIGAVLALMVVLAGMDYFFQRWDLEQQMRMTKQEVKEELKSREGDPLIKARIRRVQRQLAQRRMMEEVPKADVIVTNPTHIAVALKYDDTMVAPRVVAMGADYIAEKIKRLATEHRVPIVENKPLARAIYKTLKIGQTIPRELYTAVAEVLSYVFKLRNEMRGRI